MIDFAFGFLERFTTGNSLGLCILLLVICFARFLSGMAAAFELFLSSKSKIFDSVFEFCSSDSFIISGNVSWITVRF